MNQLRGVALLINCRANVWQMVNNELLSAMSEGPVAIDGSPPLSWKEIREGLGDEEARSVLQRMLLYSISKTKPPAGWLIQVAAVVFGGDFNQQEREFLTSILPEGINPDCKWFVQMSTSPYVQELTKSARDPAQPVLPPAPNPKFLDLPIEDLNLDVRSYNKLKIADVNTIGDLVAKTEDELCALPGFGKASLQNVKDVLEQYNLALAPSS